MCQLNMSPNEAWLFTCGGYYIVLFVCLFVLFICVRKKDWEQLALICLVSRSQRFFLIFLFFCAKQWTRVAHRFARLFRSSFTRRTIQRRANSRKTSGTTVSVLKSIYPSVSYVRVFNRTFLIFTLCLCDVKSLRACKFIFMHWNPTHDHFNMKG